MGELAHSDHTASKGRGLYICMYICIHKDFQGSTVVKNLPANAGDIRNEGLISGSGTSPGGGHGNPLQYSCLENPHGQRSLADYSPQSHKKLDMTDMT